MISFVTLNIIKNFSDYFSKFILMDIKDEQPAYHINENRSNESINTAGYDQMEFQEGGDGDGNLNYDD